MQFILCSLVKVRAPNWMWLDVAEAKPLGLSGSQRLTLSELHREEEGSEVSNLMSSYPLCSVIDNITVPNSL